MDTYIGFHHFPNQGSTDKREYLKLLFASMHLTSRLAYTDNINASVPPRELPQ